MHNSSLENLKRGITERVFFVKYEDKFVRPLSPKPGAFTTLSKFRTALIRTGLLTRKLTHREFIDSYRGQARKVRIYEAAALSLSVRAWDRHDAKVKSFVKAEKINFSAKHDPAPRIISPRDPRYNVEVGCYIKPLEHKIFRKIAEVFGGPTIMKGLNALGVGNAIKDMMDDFHNPVAVGADAKRFDQHVSREALVYEHSVYLAGYTGIQKEELAKLLSCQLDNKCVAYAPTGKISYQTRGVRCSGDMNTGLGNCLLACAMVWSYADRLGIRIRLANNGDDCVVIMEKHHYAKFLHGFFDYCKTLGFYMVLEEPVYKLEHIEFCQSHPVRTSGGVKMVRNFPISISKDMCSLLPLNTPRAWKQWSADVGACGQALGSGVPVIYEFYSLLRRSGGGTFGRHTTYQNGKAFMAKDLDDKARKITDAARVSFWEAFGMAPDTQLMLERTYRERSLIDFSERGPTDLIIKIHSNPYKQQSENIYHTR